MIGRGGRTGCVLCCRRLDLRDWGAHKLLGACDVGFAAGAGQQPVVADVVRRTYTDKWEERCRARPHARRDAPIFVFFGPAPTSATGYRAIGANFGQHAIRREEIRLRVRLDKGDKPGESVTPDDRLIVEEIGEVTPKAGDFVGAAWRSLRQAIALAVGRPVEAVRLQASLKKAHRHPRHGNASLRCTAGQWRARSRCCRRSPWLTTDDWRIADPARACPQATFDRLQWARSVARTATPYPM
jgi:hypothetical protein